MSNELYRDFIDGKADAIINSLGGTITPAPPNELYRDFLDRKFDDVINAIDNVKVKTFTYTGIGGSISTITFPSTPKFILGIFGPFDPEGDARIDAFPYGQNISISWRILKDFTHTPTGRSVFITYEPDNDKIIHIEGGDRYRALNNTGATYTVCYI